jgi:hypothetical protein
MWQDWSVECSDRNVGGPGEWPRKYRAKLAQRWYGWKDRATLPQFNNVEYLIATKKNRMYSRSVMCAHTVGRYFEKPNIPSWRPLSPRHVNL